QLGAHAAQRLVHLYHGYLYDVRRRGLERHVHRRALAEIALTVIAGMQLGYHPPPAEKAFRVSPLSRARDHLFEVLVHAREAPEVSVYIRFCLGGRYAQPFAQTERRHAVYDTEVDGLRNAALM